MTCPTFSPFMCLDISVLYNTLQWHNWVGGSFPPVANLSGPQCFVKILKYFNSNRERITNFVALNIETF